MKRTLAIVLSIVMVLALLPGLVLADWTDNTPTLSLETSGLKDGKISVTLKIEQESGAPQIVSYGLGLEFNSDLVEVDMDAGDFQLDEDDPETKVGGLSISGAKTTDSFQVNYNRTGAETGTRVFHIADLREKGITNSGMTVTFFFKVKEGTEGGTAQFQLSNLNFGGSDLFELMNKDEDMLPYPGSLQPVSVNIPKPPVTVSIEAIADQTYTGSAIEPALTVKAGEKTLTLTDDYTVTYTNNVNAGTATATIAPAGGNQFTNPAAELTKSFTINKAPASISVADAGKTYGEADPDLAALATVTGALGTDKINFTVERDAGEDAGVYNIFPVLGKNDNYHVELAKKGHFTITKADYAGAPLTGAAVVPVAGVADKAVAVSLPAGFKDVAVESVVIPPEDADFITAASFADGSIVLTTAEAAEDRTGTVTFEFSSKNYNNVEYTLTVTAKKVEAEWTTEPTGKDVVYGAKNAAAVANLGAATVKDPEGNPVSFQIEVADAETVQNAGERSVTVNVVTEAYGPVLSKTLTVTVSPAPAKVTWKNTKFEYTGAAFVPTATVTGGVNGETLSVEVTGEQINTGAHTATASLIVTGGNALAANYELDKPTCEFEITGKKITFQVTLTPDTFTENGSVQKPVVTVTAKEDVVLTADDYVVELPESIDAGTYTVTVTAKEGSPYFGSKAVTAQYKICGKPSYKSLNVSDGHTALTARYAFDNNGYPITAYEVSVVEVLFDEEGNETGVQPVEGSPFDAGTKTSYTLTKLTTGSTYRVTVKATNEAGFAVSETKEVTLTKYVAPPVPSYSISIAETENGKVVTSAANAEEGAEVKLTVTADEGYELAKLTVADAEGNELAISGSEGVYTFVMGSANVTVTATFQAIVIPAFEDVSEGAYYYEAVQWAAKNQIAKGKTETLFAPLDNASRAEVVSFLWRQAGKPEPTNSANVFEDVSEEAYYYKAVLWAVEAGVVKGKSETVFAPDATITRAELVTMLYRLANVAAPEGEIAFTDVAADAYYAEAVLWASQNGITEGTGDDTFQPNVACNRAQVITFLYRYFK